MKMQVSGKAFVTTVLVSALLVCSQALGGDYGDAPHPYPSAHHPNTTFQWLGANVSDETLPRVVDTFDDGIQWSAEDVLPGACFDLTFEASSTYETQVIVGVWIDWDRNGVWSDPSERVVDWEGTVYSSGSGYHRFVTQSIPVPITAVLGDTWMRARLNWAHSSTAPDMSPTAYQLFGECEDYSLTIVPEPGTLALLGIAATNVIRRKGRGGRNSLPYAKGKEGNL